MVFRIVNKISLLPAIAVLFLLPFKVEGANVILKTDLGDIEIELFEEQAPLTTANFKKYIIDGDYRNSFIHRSIAGFVIQGGGFNFIDGVLGIVPIDPAIQNEPGISNTRGTVAMAKVAGDPDSATSQWFINLADNTELDSSNGGFTVFGRVVGDGMNVADQIAALQTWNAGSAFSDLPLIDYPGNQAPITSDHLVMTDIVLANAFVINAGLNDAWIFEGAPLQGMFVTVFESLGVVFIAWFTFDSAVPDAGAMAQFGAPDQRWVTAAGTFEGHRAELVAELTTGGSFNSDQPAPGQQPGYGTLVLEFQDCSNGTVTFEFPDASLSGEFPISRVLNSNVALCEGLSATAPTP